MRPLEYMVGCIIVCLFFVYPGLIPVDKKRKWGELRVDKRSLVLLNHQEYSITLFSFNLLLIPSSLDEHAKTTECLSNSYYFLGIDVRYVSKYILILIFDYSCNLNLYVCIIEKV